MNDTRYSELFRDQDRVPTGSKFHRHATDEGGGLEQGYRAVASAYLGFHKIAAICRRRSHRCTPVTVGCIAVGTCADLLDRTAVAVETYAELLDRTAVAVGVGTCAGELDYNFAPWAVFLGQKPVPAALFLLYRHQQLHLRHRRNIGTATFLPFDVGFHDVDDHARIFDAVHPDRLDDDGVIYADAHLPRVRDDASGGGVFLL